MKGPLEVRSVFLQTIACHVSYKTARMRVYRFLPTIVFCLRAIAANEELGLLPRSLSCY